MLPVTLTAIVLPFRSAGVRMCELAAAMISFECGPRAYPAARMRIGIPAFAARKKAGYWPPATSTLPCCMAGITVTVVWTGLIVTCRPTLVNRPFACAMYRPAWASAGTVATTMSGFSRPVAAPEAPEAPELELPPHAAAVTAIPATAIAAMARRHERRPRPANPVVMGPRRPVFADPQPALSTGCLTLQDVSVMPESSDDAMTVAGAVTGCVTFLLIWPCRRRTRRAGPRRAGAWAHA